MPIIAARGFRASNGSIYETLEEAQRVELASLLDRAFEARHGIKELNYSALADELLAKSDELLAILTLGPKSRPKARKQAGTTNPKRAKSGASKASPEVAKAGFNAMRKATNDADAFVKKENEIREMADQAYNALTH